MYLFVVVVVVAVFLATVPVSPSINRCVDCTFSPSELIKKELECEGLVGAGSVAVVDSKYNQCIDDLIWKTGKYVESKAKADRRPVAEWISQYALKDPVLGRFTLEIVAKPSFFQNFKKRTLILPLDMTKLNQQSMHESDKTYLEIKNRMMAFNERTRRPDSNSGFMSKIKSADSGGRKSEKLPQNNLQETNPHFYPENVEGVAKKSPQTKDVAEKEFSSDSSYSVTVAETHPRKSEPKKEVVSKVKSNPPLGVLSPSKNSAAPVKKLQRLNQFRVSDDGEVTDNGFSKTTIGPGPQKKLQRLNQFRVSDGGEVTDNGFSKTTIGPGPQFTVDTTKNTLDNSKKLESKNGLFSRMLPSMSRVSTKAKKDGNTEKKIKRLNQFRVSDSGEVMDNGFPKTRISEVVNSAPKQKELLSVHQSKVPGHGRTVGIRFTNTAIKKEVALSSPEGDKQKLEQNKKSDELKVTDSRIPKPGTTPKTESTANPPESKLNTKTKSTKWRSWNPLRIFQ